MKNVLFLCTGNSARSILAEAIVNREGIGKFRGFSAGSHPKGEVHPMALDLLRRLNHDISGLRSKSWDEFALPDAPKMDFVFTVCDQAAAEECPYWPGQPMTAHWGLPDPAAVGGQRGRKGLAFAETYRMLKNRISIFVNLPLATLDKLALKEHLDEIGKDRARIPSPERTGMTDMAAASPGGMGIFERWLTLWVALAMAGGILIGVAAPGLVNCHCRGRGRLDQPRRGGADLGDGLSDDGRRRLRAAVAAWRRPADAAWWSRWR